MFKRKISGLIIFFLFSLSLIGQVKSYFGGTLNVFGSSGSSPEYTIQGFFNDASGEYPLDSVAVGDILYIQEGATCARLRVDTINSSAGGILDADVYDIDAILLSPPSGIGALMRETPNASLPRYIPGLSETLLACIRTHMTGKVDEEIAAAGDGNGIISALPAAPVIIDANNNALIIDSTSTTNIVAVGTAQGNMVISGASSLASSFSHIAGADTSQVNIKADIGISLNTDKNITFNLDNRQDMK